MPVLPEFMPEGRPGEAADSFIQGRNAGESWMSMQQERDIREQQAQQQRDMFIAQLPAIHAQAQANVVQANAAIALATRQQQLRAQAAIVAPEANNEFLDALQLADPQSQFNELGKLQAKYAWMSNVPEYKPFLDVLDKSRGDAFHLATANNLAEATLERTKMLVEGRTAGIEQTVQGRERVAEIGASARTQAATISGEARKTAAETAAESRIAVQAEKNSAAVGKAGASLADLQAREDSENVAAQEALSANDQELANFHLARAAQFHDAAVKASTYTGSGPSEPAKKPTPIVKKLYVPPKQPGQIPTFSSAVKDPADVIKAMQQMVDDGHITADQARETLKRLGFKPKQ